MLMTSSMAKGKNTSGQHTPTPGASTTSTLGQSANTSAMQPMQEIIKSCKTTHESQNTESKTIETNKKLLKNLQRQHKLAETMAQITKKQQLLAATLKCAGLLAQSSHSTMAQDDESTPAHPES